MSSIWSLSIPNASQPNTIYTRPKYKQSISSEPWRVLNYTCDLSVFIDLVGQDERKDTRADVRLKLCSCSAFMMINWIDIFLSGFLGDYNLSGNLIYNFHQIKVQSIPQFSWFQYFLTNFTKFNWFFDSGPKPLNNCFSTLSLSWAKSI